MNETKLHCKKNFTDSNSKKFICTVEDYNYIAKNKAGFDNHVVAHTKSWTISRRVFGKALVTSDGYTFVKDYRNKYKCMGIDCGIRLEYKMLQKVVLLSCDKHQHLPSEVKNCTKEVIWTDETASLGGSIYVSKLQQDGPIKVYECAVANCCHSLFKMDSQFWISNEDHDHTQRNKRNLGNEVEGDDRPAPKLKKYMCDKQGCGLSFQTRSDFFLHSRSHTTVLNEGLLDFASCVEEEVLEVACNSAVGQVSTNISTHVHQAKDGSGFTICQTNYELDMRKAENFDSPHSYPSQQSISQNLDSILETGLSRVPRKYDTIEAVKGYLANLQKRFPEDFYERFKKECTELYNSQSTPKTYNRIPGYESFFMYEPILGVFKYKYKGVGWGQICTKQRCFGRAREGMQCPKHSSLFVDCVQVETDINNSVEAVYSILWDTRKLNANGTIAEESICGQSVKSKNMVHINHYKKERNSLNSPVRMTSLARRWFAGEGRTKRSHEFRSAIVVFLVLQKLATDGTRCANIRIIGNQFKLRNAVNSFLKDLVSSNNLRIILEDEEMYRDRKLREGLTESSLKKALINFKKCVNDAMEGKYCGKQVFESVFEHNSKKMVKPNNIYVLYDGGRMYIGQVNQTKKHLVDTVAVSRYHCRAAADNSSAGSHKRKTGHQMFPIPIFKSTTHLDRDETCVMLAVLLGEMNKVKHKGENISLLNSMIDVTRLTDGWIDVIKVATLAMFKRKLAIFHAKNDNLSNMPLFKFPWIMGETEDCSRFDELSSDESERSDDSEVDSV